MADAASPMSRRADRLAWATRAVVMVAAGAALTYVVVRAVGVGFTYDEAHTYFHYVGAPLGTILGYHGIVTANNHSLNSLLMTLTQRSLGDSELALRLPNVVAFGGYVASVLWLLFRVCSLPSRLVGGALLLLNPFLLEVFSLARGYGLALGLEAAALATLGVAVHSRREIRHARAHLTLSAGLSALAVLANLTFLNFFVPWIIVVAWIRVHLGRRTTRRGHEILLDLWSPAAICGLLALYAVPAVWRLRAVGELYYGGRTGFWSDTVDSLIRCWLYIQPYASGARPLLWVLVGMSLVLGISLALRRGDQPWDFRSVMLRALLFCLIAGGGGSIVQHHLLGTPYLLNRTAIWMVPCFLLVIVLEADIVLTGGAGVARRIVTAITWSLTVGSVAHFALSANSQYAILQYHDADTKEMLRDLSRVHERSATRGKPVDLEASWELVPAIEYYRVTKRLSWLRDVTTVAGRADAAYVSAKDLSQVVRLTERKRYSRTGNTLATTQPLGAP